LYIHPFIATSKDSEVLYVSSTSFMVTFARKILDKSAARRTIVIPRDDLHSETPLWKVLHSSNEEKP
jgi:hypothetical protein